MSTASQQPDAGRQRNIYKRTNAAGREVFEVGYRDSTGKQRWQAVDGGIMAARAVRDDVLGSKGPPPAGADPTGSSGLARRPTTG